jgi:hypothetical protein
MNQEIDETVRPDETDERAALVEEARAILDSELAIRPNRDHLAAILSMLDGSPWPPSRTAYGQLPLRSPVAETLY